MMPWMPSAGEAAEPEDHQRAEHAPDARRAALLDPEERGQDADRDRDHPGRNAGDAGVRAP